MQISPFHCKNKCFMVSEKQRHEICGTFQMLIVFAQLLHTIFTNSQFYCKGMLEIHIRLNEINATKLLINDLYNFLRSALAPNENIESVFGNKRNSHPSDHSIYHSMRVLHHH